MGPTSSRPSRRKTARPLGRPPAAESAETRERILGAARSCFAELGYASTTNRDIGERAGLTAGAIYHYFDSKDELFGAVTEQVVTRIFSEFDRVLEESSSFVDRVRGLLDIAIELHREDASLARFSTVYPVELLRHKDLADRVPAELWGRGLGFFHQLAQDAADAGELQPDVSPGAVANMLLSITTGLAHFATLDEGLEEHTAAVLVVERLFAGTLVDQRAAAASAP
ncbi:MAG: TetR/AcrR family transcriptional regulator [Acidimicrobiales bacterium]|nr:TetR/AcrR family transcriptional regulator [Acidimicrobiales bacterium]